MGNVNKKSVWKYTAVLLLPTPELEVWPQPQAYLACIGWLWHWICIMLLAPFPKLPSVLSHAGLAEDYSMRHRQYRGPLFFCSYGDTSLNTSWGHADSRLDISTIIYESKSLILVISTLSLISEDFSFQHMKTWICQEADPKLQVSFLYS